MAVRSLEGVYDRLARVINLNFSKPIAIDAIVKNIEIEHNIFTISNEANDKILTCTTQMDISQLKPNDNIRLRGYLTINSNNLPEPFLNVDYFYLVEQHDIYAQKIDMYNKLHKILMKEKCQKILNRHYMYKAPEYVFNVGLIVCTTDKNSINNFINGFKEKCVGELYVYHVEESTNDKTFRSALEYFRKYHHIDLVCVLSEKMSIENILLLSSKDNVAYLLNRKNTPYIISVIDKSHSAPLSGVLSNKNFYSAPKCIEFVQNIQNNFMTILSDNISVGTKELDSIITGYKNRLLELEMSIAGLNDTRFPIKLPPNDPFELLKGLVLRRLTKDRLLLSNIETLIMKKVIEDTTVKRVYTEIIDSHNRRNQQQLENKKIENKTSDCTVDNTKLSINIERQDGEF